MATEQRTQRDDDIKQTVNERYGVLAQRVLAEMGDHAAKAPDSSGNSNVDGGCCESGADVNGRTSLSNDACCAPGTELVGAQRASDGGIVYGSRLYSRGEANALPDAAVSASLGCGNPVAIAELNAGERVLDLGSGGGIDCLLAAKQVGADGEIWGLDMTTSMVRLARRNAESANAANVRFRLGEIEDIPFAENYFDVIISNCVINLSPDKEQVFREAFRVLKPGGRLRVSDMVWIRDVPMEERGDREAIANCIAGALPLGEYLGGIEAAGFVEVAAECPQSGLSLASADVSAIKPK